MTHTGFYPRGPGGGPDWKTAAFVGVIGLLGVGAIIALGLAIGAGL